MSEREAEAMENVPQRRACLIMNPQSWHGTTDKEAVESLVTALQRHGIQAEVAFTTPTEHGDGLAKEATSAGFDLVIAAGGDGTIQAVVQGLLGGDLPLGIIPLGTINNIAHSLQIPADVDAACAVIATGKHQCIDVGIANGTVFLEAVSIGIEAPLFAIGEEAHHRGPLHAARAALKAFHLVRRSNIHHLKLELDGKYLNVRTRQITICNMPHYGLSMSVAPDADVQDGLLDVVITHPHRNPWRLIPFYWNVLRHADHGSQVKIRRAHHIFMKGRHPFPVAADGIVIGTTPLTVDVLTNQIEVLVPAYPLPITDVTPIQRLINSIIPMAS